MTHRAYASHTLEALAPVADGRRTENPTVPHRIRSSVLVMSPAGTVVVAVFLIPVP